MKRSMLVVFAVFMGLAFAGSAMATAKTGTKTAAKSYRTSGVVMSYAAGKHLTIKRHGKTVLVFEIAPKARIKEEFKAGEKVIVHYLKNGDRMIASTVSKLVYKHKSTPKAQAPSKKS